MQTDAYEVFEVPNSNGFFYWRPVPIKDLDKEVYLDTHSYFLLAQQAIAEVKRRNAIVQKRLDTKQDGVKDFMSSNMIDFSPESFKPDTDAKSLIRIIDIITDLNTEVQSLKNQMKSEQDGVPKQYIYEVFYAVYADNDVSHPIRRGWSRVLMDTVFDYVSYCKSLDDKYRTPDKYIEIISVTQIS